MQKLKKEQIAIGNYHYTAWSFDAFLRSVQELGLTNRGAETLLRFRRSARRFWKKSLTVLMAIWVSWRSRPGWYEGGMIRFSIAQPFRIPCVKCCLW